MSAGFRGNVLEIFTTSCGNVIVFPFKPFCCPSGPHDPCSVTTYILARYFEMNNFSGSVKPESSGGVFPIWKSFAILKAGNLSLFKLVKQELQHNTVPFSYPPGESNNPSILYSSRKS